MAWSDDYEALMRLEARSEKILSNLREMEVKKFNEPKEFSYFFQREKREGRKEKRMIAGGLSRPGKIRLVKFLVEGGKIFGFDLETIILFTDRESKKIYGILMNAPSDSGDSWNLTIAIQNASFLKPQFLSFPKSYIGVGVNGQLVKVKVLLTTRDDYELVPEKYKYTLTDRMVREFLGEEVLKPDIYSSEILSSAGLKSSSSTQESKIHEALAQEGISEEDAILYLKSMKVKRQRAQKKEEKKQRELAKDRQLLI